MARRLSQLLLVAAGLAAPATPAVAIPYFVGPPSFGLAIPHLTGVIELEGPLVDGSRVAVSGLALSGRVEERTSCTPGGSCTVPFVFGFTLDLDLAKESFLELRAIDGELRPSGIIHLILALESPFSTQPGGSVTTALVVTESSQLVGQLVGSDCGAIMPSDCTLQALANMVGPTRLEIDGLFELPDGLPETFPDVWFYGVRAVGVVPEPGILPISLVGLAFLRPTRGRRPRVDPGSRSPSGDARAAP